MFEQRRIKMALVAPVLVAALSWQATPANAWRWERRHPRPFYTPHFVPHGRFVERLPDKHVRIIVGGLEYFFWEGMFYQMREHRYVVVPAPVGAVVTTIPSECQPVVVDGVPYYTVNETTYKSVPSGYQVVPPPPPIAATITEPEPEVPAGASTSVEVASTGHETQAVGSENEFTINIPNAKGGYTAVTLRRSGQGFTGPQGEYYPEFPRIDQLKVMYGK